MPSLWQAASGRPGQRTERRRRSKGSLSRPERDKSQLQSKLPGSGVGALAGGLARTGLPWEESGWRLLSQSLRPPGGWPAAGAVCGRQTQGLGVLKVRAWEEEERERTEAGPLPCHPMGPRCGLRATPLEGGHFSSPWSMLLSWGSCGPRGSLTPIPGAGE